MNIICGVDGLYIGGARFNSNDEKLLNWSIDYKRLEYDKDEVYITSTISVRVNNFGRFYIVREMEGWGREIDNRYYKSMVIGLDLAGIYKELDTYNKIVLYKYRDGEYFKEELRYLDKNSNVWKKSDTLLSVEDMKTLWKWEEYRRKSYDGDISTEPFTLYRNNPKSIAVRRWLSYYQGELYEED